MGEDTEASFLVLRSADVVLPANFLIQAQRLFHHSVR